MDGLVINTANTTIVNNINPPLPVLTAGKSLDELPYGKMTPSTRMMKVQSIRSPFYKHPHIAGEILRRAQTPNID